MTYEEYLKTPEWQALRSERLLMDNYECQICHSKESLQVHHINYVPPYNWGQEIPSKDLITLCKGCHKEIEDAKTRARRFKHIAEMNAEAIRKIAESGELYKRTQGRDFSNPGIVRKWLTETYPRNAPAEFSAIEIARFVQLERYRVILQERKRGHSNKQIKEEFNYTDKMLNKPHEEIEAALIANHQKSISYRVFEEKPTLFYDNIPY